MYEDGEIAEVPSSPIKFVTTVKETDEAWIEELQLIRELLEKFKRQVD